MRVVAIALVAAAALYGQNRQQGPRAEWPCVPGRAVDPAYLEASESTGGQVFLLQKSEAAYMGLTMNASPTHPATILRAIGHLNGDRDFEFPVDSTVESLLFLVSLQCRQAIRVNAAGGREMTDRNSAQSVDLQAGRILRVDQPERGAWRVHLAGTGLFIVSVLAKSEIALPGVRLSGNTALLNFRGKGAQMRLHLAGAGGEPLSDDPLEATESGYRAAIVPRTERFRVSVTGVDEAGWPFQRVNPVLFRSGAGF
jgi:hypothetical protein